MRQNKLSIGTILIIGIIVLIIVSMISVCIGSYPLSIKDILNIIFNKNTDDMAVNVFYSLRLPRVAVGILAGVTLGMSGAVFQLIFRNPLASPDLVGVASGASLGTACAIVLGGGSVVSMISGSFIGGMSSLLFVIILVEISGNKGTGTYILAGIVISALANALIMILKYMADSEGQLAAIDFWTMGSLASVTITKLQIIIVPILISLLVILLLKKEILLLSLGDEQAIFLGINCNIMRMIILSFCTLATASIISVTGVISFIGLLAPHISFLLLKVRSEGYFIASGIFGGILVVLSDCFARSLTTSELPTSILTTLLSVPFLIFLMSKKKGVV